MLLLALLGCPVLAVQRLVPLEQCWMHSGVVMGSVSELVG